ncbi:hypothetical protein NKG94_34425 [Micromonospora sp. M12]
MASATGRTSPPPTRSLPGSTAAPPGASASAARPLRVLARTVTLDTDVDADPANWVSWTLAAFGEPRTRCPLLRINLLNRTVADRKALLKLRVGDRIQLTDMPAGSRRTSRT